MKITKDDKKLFAKLIENEMQKIDGVIGRFRHMKQDLDFEAIQDAILKMAMLLPEFWEPGSDEGDGGVTADLKTPAPTKTPGRKKAVPVG